ncbi:M17 family peptidase N-terminal domain-containing protein [Nannocystaceae bacterium ST9]
MTLARAQVLVEALQRAVLDGVHEFEGEPDRIRVDLGLIPVFADERPLQGLAGLMDWRRSGRLSSLVRSGFCTGAAGERVLMPGNAGLPVERLVLVGLGPRGEFDGEAARRVARDLVTTATGLSAARVLVALPAHAERRPAELLFAALTEAIEQADRERVSATGSDSHAGSGELVGAGEPEPGEPAPAEAPAAPTLVEAILEAVPEADPAQAPDEAPNPTAPEPAQPAQPLPPLHWWVVADERVVARLRRVLSGPPRATTGGLHT